MGMLEEIEKAVTDGDKAVIEAEMAIRILKAADEDTGKLEADLKLSKDKLEKLKKAILKEKPQKV